VALSHVTTVQLSLLFMLRIQIGPILFGCANSILRLNIQCIQKFTGGAIRACSLYVVEQPLPFVGRVFRIDSEKFCAANFASTRHQRISREVRISWARLNDE